MKQIPRILLSLCLVANTAALASEEEHTGGHESEHLKWGAGIFLGGTEVHDEWESTLGIELTYHINPKWSTFALIERSERNEDTTLGLLGLGWHPWKELILIAGVGRKDPGDQREYATRLGVAYEIHLGENWYLEPLIAVDTIEDHEEELVLGVYLGRRF